ncbi:hypothetical protein ACJX0J_028680, partial [Zea mays]
YHFLVNHLLLMLQPEATKIQFIHLQLIVKVFSVCPNPVFDCQPYKEFASHFAPGGIEFSYHLPAGHKHQQIISALEDRIVEKLIFHIDVNTFDEHLSIYLHNKILTTWTHAYARAMYIMKVKLLETWFSLHIFNRQVITSISCFITVNYAILTILKVNILVLSKLGKLDSMKLVYLNIFIRAGSSDNTAPMPHFYFHGVAKNNYFFFFDLGYDLEGDDEEEDEIARTSVSGAEIPMGVSGAKIPMG